MAQAKKKRRESGQNSLADFFLRQHVRPAEASAMQVPKRPWQPLASIIHKSFPHRQA
jgi:hypothetical protein